MFRISALLALALAPAVLVGEVENEIPFGVEFVTGVRSDYVYRGINLAGTTLDAQIETEIVFADDWSCHLGGWLASEMSGTFSEGGGYAELRNQFSPTLTIGGAYTYVARDMAPIGDTSDLSLFLQYFPSDEIDFKLLGSRDFETSGWYSAFEGGWSYRFSDDAYFLLLNGVSWANDFHGRDGWNDYYGRLSVTYAVSSTVSVTPFAGWSLLLDEPAGAGDTLFAGLWFEVFF